jgi:hypothetical protein
MTRCTVNQDLAPLAVCGRGGDTPTQTIIHYNEYLEASHGDEIESDGGTLQVTATEIRHMAATKGNEPAMIRERSMRESALVWMTSVRWCRRSTAGRIQLRMNCTRIAHQARPVYAEAVDVAASYTERAHHGRR